MTDHRYVAGSGTTADGYDLGESFASPHDAAAYASQAGHEKIARMVLIDSRFVDGWMAACQLKPNMRHLAIADICSAYGLTGIPGHGVTDIEDAANYLDDSAKAG